MPLVVVMRLSAPFGELADEVVWLYPARSADEVIQTATDRAGDRLIGYSTWKEAGHTIQLSIITSHGAHGIQLMLQCRK